MALTNEEIVALIGFNLPDNIQQLITPAKVRQVLNEMQAFSVAQAYTPSDTLQSVSDRGAATDKTLTMAGLRIASGDFFATLQAVSTVNRTHTLPDVSGTLLTDGGSYTNPAWLVSIPISKVSGLQTALDGKAAVSHTHVWADITDKPTTFTPSAHSHVWADITDKPSTFTPSAHTHALSDLTQSGASSGQVPQWNGSAWVAATVSGGGTPGGSNTHVQFNNSGAFGGSADFTWNNTTKTLTITNTTIGNVSISTNSDILSSAGFSVGGSASFTNVGFPTSAARLSGTTTFSLFVHGGNRSVTIVDAATFTALASSMLTIESTTKGVRIPIMNVTQLAAISSPANGLLAISSNSTNANALRRFNGTEWAGAESDNWVDYSSTSTVVGWSSTTTKVIRYQQSHRRLSVQFNISGTSNSATTTFTLPFSMGANGIGNLPLFRCINASNSCIAYAVVTGSTVSFVVYDAINSITNFASSGTKTIYGSFVIEID